jgi:hypothetical protein
VDAVEKWLKLIEGYFSVHNFSDRENITFALLKSTPMSNIGGILSVSKRQQRNLHYFLVTTTWDVL